jgi:hypothetical protein
MPTQQLLFEDEARRESESRLDVIERTIRKFREELPPACQRRTCWDRLTFRKGRGSVANLRSGYDWSWSNDYLYELDVSGLVWRIYPQTPSPAWMNDSVVHWLVWRSDVGFDRFPDVYFKTLADAQDRAWADAREQVGRAVEHLRRQAAEIIDDMLDAVARSLAPDPETYRMTRRAPLDEDTSEDDPRVH